VGRLVERKGHDTVLRALSLLKEQFPDLHYLIVGDGPYRTQLESITRSLQLTSRVIFFGKANPDDLPSLYRLGDLFVMITRPVEEKGDVEGFGIVYLEAAASGLPVVASKSGGVKDSVKENETGLLVDAADSPEAAAQAIARLFTDKALHERMAIAAVEHAKGFTWEKQRERWIR
jgi:phosphatidyl-myo-inositol dimannoside synthase